MRHRRIELTGLLGMLLAAVTFAAIPPSMVHTVSFYVVEVDLAKAAAAKLDLSKDRTPGGIEAWFKHGAVVLIASPKISTVDGRESHFQVGGTDIRLIPTAAGNGRVRLQSRCEFHGQSKLPENPALGFTSTQLNIATWVTLSETDTERHGDDGLQRIKTIALVRVDTRKALR